MDDLIKFVRPLRETDLVEPTPVDVISERGRRRRRRTRVRRRAGAVAAFAAVMVVVAGVVVTRSPAPVTVDSAGSTDSAAVGEDGTVPAPPVAKGQQRWLLGPDEYRQLPPGTGSEFPHDDDATELTAASEFVAIIEPVVGLTFAGGRAWEQPNRQASATFTPTGDATTPGTPPDAISVTVAQLSGPFLAPTLATQPEFDATYHASPDGTESLAAASNDSHRSYALIVVPSGVLIEVVHETWGVPRTAEDVFQLAVEVADAIDAAGWLPAHLERTATPVPADLEDSGGPSKDPNATTTTADWLAASGPPPELPVDDPFRIATDTIATPRGWTYTDSGSLGSVEAPFLLVVYGIPDGRSVSFTKEPTAGPMPSGPISEQQLADMTSVDGDLSFIRSVDIEGGSGRTYVTGPSGTRYSAALAPPSKDGRTVYPPLGEPWPTYSFSLGDLEEILVDGLVRPDR